MRNNTPEKSPDCSLVFRLTLLFTIAPLIFTANVGADVSVEVQENIDRLIKTNSCAECNLTGADLNRLNLSGSDLRGADLSGATFFLGDLSGANLSGAVLRGTQFGGADLAEADLRGADLRGAFLTGAYTVGSLMDGSLVDKQMLDEDAGISLHEKVFIPDDDKSKELPDKQDVKISKRRDFDSVPPVVEEAKLTEGDGIQGPAALAIEQEAPAVKTVAPVHVITISEPAEPSVQQEKPIEPEPENKEVLGLASAGSDKPVELVAGNKVKVQIEPEYQELADEKKMSLEAESTNLDETVIMAIDSEEKEAGTSVFNESPEQEISEQKEENPPPPVVMPEASEPLLSQSAIQETDLLSGTTAALPETEASSEKVAGTGVDKPVQDESPAAETIVEESSGPVVAESTIPSGVPMALEPSEKEVVVPPQDIASSDRAIVRPEDAAVIEEEVAGIVPGAVGADNIEWSLAKLLDTNRCLGCNLAGVDLSGKNLNEADLERSNFNNSILEGVDLSEANLKGVSFRNANLKNADFRKADLYKANFSGADLSGADFGGAQLDETNFAGAIGYNTEIMAE